MISFIPVHVNQVCPPCQFSSYPPRFDHVSHTHKQLLSAQDVEDKKTGSVVLSSVGQSIASESVADGGDGDQTAPEPPLTVKVEPVAPPSPQKSLQERKEGTASEWLLDWTVTCRIAMSYCNSGIGIAWSRY